MILVDKPVSITYSISEWTGIAKSLAAMGYAMNPGELTSERNVLAWYFNLVENIQGSILKAMGKETTESDSE